MREGWEIQPLQALCDNFRQDIVDGPFGSELQRKDYVTAGVPVLKIQNVKPFAVELKKMDYVSTAKFEELRRHSYQPGDIVMTKLGSPLGVSAIVEGIPEGVIVADLVRIRAKRVNTKYLCYHLNSQQTNDFINTQQKGTTRPRVTLSVVRELPILVPPLEDQQRIVGVLDEAFAGLAVAQANAAKNLQNARALFESYLQAVFSQQGKGWVVSTIGDLCILKSGTTLSPDLEQTEGDIPYLKVGDMSYAGNENDITTSSRFLRQSDVKDSSVIPAGATIFPKRGGAILTNKKRITSRPICADLNIMAVIPPSIISPRFLYYYFVNVDMRKLGTGSSIPQINNYDIAPLVISYPKLRNDQLEVVSQLDALSAETKRLARLYEQKQAQLAALKKSLLHQAFNGNL